MIINYIHNKILTAKLAKYLFYFIVKKAQVLIYINYFFKITDSFIT